MARRVSRRTFLRGTLGLSLGAGTAALGAGCGRDAPPAANAAAAQTASPENPVLWPVSTDKGSPRD
jgi:hypothetical protein